jgi:hypothetical protein
MKKKEKTRKRNKNVKKLGNFSWFNMSATLA